MSSSAVEYKCFVGGLAWATTNESLTQVFSRFGDIADSQIIMDRWTGRSRGFGFVTFREERAMRDAIEWMDGKELEGRTITVEAVRHRGSDGGGSRCPHYDGGYGGGGGGAFGRWEQSILDLIEDGPNEPRGPRRDGGSGGDGGAYIEWMDGEELDGRTITVEAVRPRGSDGGGYGGGGGGAFGRWEQSILDLIDDGRNEPRGPRRDGGSGGDGGAHARREGAYGGGRSGGYGRREGGYGRGRRPAVMVKVMFFK